MSTSSISPRRKAIEDGDIKFKDVEMDNMNPSNNEYEKGSHSTSIKSSPSKDTQPRRPVSITSSPSSSSSTHPYITSSTPSATSASSSATPSSQHPLAQPPINAATSATPSPAPLPLLSLAPPQVNSLRSALVRRRSSFPPATTPGSGSASNIFPWVMGGTPGAKGFDWGSALDSFPGFNMELGEGASGGTGLTPGSLAWDTLLNFDTDIKPSPSKLNPSTVDSIKQCISSDIKTTTNPSVPRAKSDPLSDNNPIPPPADPFTYRTTAPTPSMLPQAAVSPARIIQLGTDLAWRTALASVVEVDGVGQVTVARVLQEVWRRGGGELVTNQCLWPSIVIALSMPSEPGPGVRVPNPSAQSAMALQQLYNLSIRHWEPAIFTGLLGTYGSSTSSPSDPPATDTINAFAPNQHYGPSTPLKEPDVSQWMNLTPSGWNTDALFGGGNDNQTQRNLFGGFPFPLNADLGSETFAARRTSLAKTENGEETNIKSIDEILASMEEGNVENERAMMAANLMAEPQISIPSLPPSESGIPSAGPSRQNSTYQFPTPETDSSNSPSSGKTSNKNPTTTLSPVSMASPHVTAGSMTSTLVGLSPTTSNLQPQPDPQTGGKSFSQKPRPTQLSMPPVEFIPPPPMCMFFNPSFENLTDGKAGIWRGDLEVRGRGGGKFPILVIGEKDTEHLWQSHLWPSTLAYPLNQHPVESCTSTMIPVSHLAREGLVPITMGMVLCNEPPERLAPYVNMVHGLHAEGVGFHLPCETRLPIVFLPAKFHSTDPLLRLGIAFMGKTGFSHPNAPLPSSNTTSRGRGIKNTSESEDQPKKKRRRQSAPAASSESGGRGRKRKDSGIIVMGTGSMTTTVGKIDEEGE